MTFRLSLSLAAAAFVCLTATIPAAAQAPARVAVPGPNTDWVQINRDESGTSYVDRRNISRENGIVRFLIRIDHAANEHGFVQSFHVGEIDCARRLHRGIGFDAFGANNELILSHTNSLEDYPPEDIVDDSPTDALHREHCG